MTLRGHDTREIFPDFRSFIHPPVSAAWFQPKAWGIADSWASPSSVLLHTGVRFDLLNIQIGDQVSILDHEPLTAAVSFVFPPDAFIVNIPPVASYTDVLYKVGHGAPHTMYSISQIVSARGIAYQTIHHGKLWTGARLPDWFPDHRGDVYVISHDTKKARWLDGDIPMPVGFPDEPDRPPGPLLISDWETRFPGIPRPDYPPGLEPGGDLRAALIADHGSLLAAEEAYLEVPI